MPRASKYERLSEEQRTSRSTIADAVDVLREAVDFKGRDRAKVVIGSLRLPSDEMVGLVQLVFESRKREKGFVVSLPTSTQFKGACRGSTHRKCFDIGRLHGATVDCASNVVLSDGEELRAVEFIRALLPLEPSALDWKIVHHTLSIIGVAEHCYRPWPVSGQLVLDCGTFSKMRLPLPPLKELAWRLEDRDLTLKGLSQQKIADALRAFGIRRPIARPRRNASRSANEI